MLVDPAAEVVRRDLVAARQALLGVTAEARAADAVRPGLVLMDRAGLPRSLLKFSGGSVDDYATFSASFTTSPRC